MPDILKVPRWKLLSTMYSGDERIELWESTKGTLKKTVWMYKLGRKYWKDAF